jgi:hypothetical protein
MRFLKSVMALFLIPNAIARRLAPPSPARLRGIGRPAQGLGIRPDARQAAQFAPVEILTKWSL